MRTIDLALKDIRQVLRDRNALLFLLVMPVVFTYFFGFAFNNQSKGTDPRLAIGVVNHDPDGLLSKALVDQLNASETVRAEMIDACRIVSSEGKTLAYRPQARGEGFAIAEVALPERRPQPRGPQPNGQPSRLSYFVSDTFLPHSMYSIYEHGIKKIRR